MRRASLEGQGEARLSARRRSEDDLQQKGDFDLYIKPPVFESAFGTDLPAQAAAVAAASQRPVPLSLLTGPSGKPAWKNIPSWYVIGTEDRVLPAAKQMVMARRAHSHITKVNAGHLSMISQADAVTNVILEAASAS